jgi:hypothetical protein
MLDSDTKDLHRIARMMDLARLHKNSVGKRGIETFCSRFKDTYSRAAGEIRMNYSLKILRIYCGNRVILR